MFLMFFSIIASAQRSGDRLHKMRVRDGIRSGELSRPELRDVRRDEFRYNMMQQRAKRNGEVTPAEKRRLQKMKMENSRQLFRYKHNRQRRVI